MIADHLSKLETYRGLSSRLDQAIDYILTHELTDLPIGRIEIDSDNLFANHMTYVAAPLSDEKKFEVHQRYVDIQIIVSGHEGIALAPSEVLATVEEYPDDDVSFLIGQPDHTVKLRENMFIILFPGEPHMPGLAVDNDNAIEKVVVKVAY